MNKKTFLVNAKSIIYFIKTFSLAKTDIDDCYLYIKEKLDGLYLRPSKTEPWVCYTLYELFRYDFFFNGKCNLGSILCLLDLDDGSLLVQGELLANVSGKKWPHVWIEFSFNDQNMVLDTTMRAIFYKDIYYSLYEPKVNKTTSREVIIADDYIQAVLSELINPENNLDLSEFNDKWQVLKKL